MFNWLAFLTYALVTAITPGPNNIMSLSNAGRLGIKKSFPFNLGIGVGFCVVMSLCTIFASLLEGLIPMIKTPMLIAGAFYLLFLAWQTLRHSGEIHEKQGESSFFSGFVLQFVNPKIYIYALVSMEAYILPYYAGRALPLFGFAMLLAFIGFACTLLWAAFGQVFKLLFSRYAKLTNTIMALLLVVCAVMLFL